jgi:integrase
MTESLTDILQKLTPADLDKLKLLAGIFGAGQAQLNVKQVTVMQGISEYESYAEFNLSPKSLSLIKTANRRFLKFFPGNKLLHTIELEDAENLFRENSKSAPSGAINYNRCYRAMFNRFKVLGYVTFNPFEIKLPGRQKEEPVVICNEHLNIIYDRLKEKGKLVIADMVVFAVESGLRVGEETCLRWSDLDFNNRVMTIGSKSFKTKSRRIRKIPFNPRIEEILNRNKQRQLDKAKKLREFVFSQPNGKPYQIDTASKAFKNVCKENNLPKEYHWHALRSTAATRWASNKVPIFTVCKLLGHSSVNVTTRYYAGLELDELRDAMNRI